MNSISPKTSSAFGGPSARHLPPFSPLNYRLRLLNIFQTFLFLSTLPPLVGKVTIICFWTTMINTNGLPIPVRIPFQLIPQIVKKGIIQNKKFDSDMHLGEKKKTHHLSHGFPLLLVSKASDPHSVKMPCVLPLLTFPVSILTLTLPSSCGSSFSSWNTSCSFPSENLRRCSPSA